MAPQPSQPTPENTPEVQAASEVATAVNMARPRRFTGEFPRNQFQFLFIAYAIINFLGPIVFEGGGPNTWPLVAIWSGALFAQGVFLTIWAALGPYRLLVRWALVLLYAFVLFYSFGFGIIVSDSHQSMDEILPGIIAFSFLIPLPFLVLQIPLWIRRVISGWEIIPIEEVETHKATQTRQFGLAHILGLMVFLAVALSLAQVTTSILEITSRHDTMEVQSEIWKAMGIICAVFCPYIAICAGPALRACFLSQDKGAGCGLMALVWITVSLLAMLVFAIIGLFVEHRFSLPFEVIAALFLHFGAMLFVLMTSLHIFRACGYEMVRVQRKRLPSWPQGPLIIGDLGSVEEKRPAGEKPKNEESPTE